MSNFKSDHCLFQSTPHLYLINYQNMLIFSEFPAFSPTACPFSGWVCCNGFLLLLAAVRLALLDSGLGVNARSAVRLHLCPGFCPPPLSSAILPPCQPASWQVSHPLDQNHVILWPTYKMNHIKACSFNTTHVLFASWIHSCKKYLVNYLLSARLEVSW